MRMKITVTLHCSKHVNINITLIKVYRIYLNYFIYLKQQSGSLNETKWEHIETSKIDILKPACKYTVNRNNCVGLIHNLSIAFFINIPIFFLITTLYRVFQPIKIIFRQ